MIEILQKVHHRLTSCFCEFACSNVFAFPLSQRKVELHVHLDGSFDNELLHSYITSYKDQVYDRLPKEAHLPWDDSTIPIRSAIEKCQNAQDLHALFTCRGKRSLHEMITPYNINDYSTQ